MTLRKTLFSFFAAMLIASPALAGDGHDHADHGDTAMAEVGHMAPGFELVDHMGKTHKLSDYKGKTVVLEWTNPQCPYVVAHYKAGTMTSLAKAHSDVVWLAIDSSNFVTAASASDWAKKQDIGYPILLDASGTVGRAYAAKTTPHMFVIDAKGTLVYSGAIDNDSNPIDGIAEGTTNYVAEAVMATTKGKAVETATTKPYGCSVKYGKKDATASASR